MARWLKSLETILENVDSTASKLTKSSSKSDKNNQHQSFDDSTETNDINTSDYLNFTPAKEIPEQKLNEEEIFQFLQGPLQEARLKKEKERASSTVSISHPKPPPFAKQNLANNVATTAPSTSISQKALNNEPSNVSSKQSAPTTPKRASEFFTNNSNEIDSKQVASTQNDHLIKNEVIGEGKPKRNENNAIKSASTPEVPQTPQQPNQEQFQTPIQKIQVQPEITFQPQLLDSSPTETVDSQQHNPSQVPITSPSEISIQEKQPSEGETKQTEISSSLTSTDTQTSNQTSQQPEQPTPLSVRQPKTTSQINDENYQQLEDQLSELTLENKL